MKLLSSHLTTSSVLIFFLLLLVLIKLVIAQSSSGTMNYVTWNDLTVGDGDHSDRRLDSSESYKVIVVDKNGGGDASTVQGAVDMVPVNNARRVKVHILAGLYSEKVYIPGSKPYISFIGDPNDPSGTVITWHDKASDRDSGGGLVGTWNSATVAVESDYFCASGVTFQNTVVGPGSGADGYQAVALRIAGDKAVFYKVRFLGSQDTLLDETGTHYYLQCFIQGQVDFIFGNARSLYQECTISLVNGYAITAQSRNSPNENTGFSFVNCTVDGTGYILLGRAWGDYSTVIYSLTQFNVDVVPKGWDVWGFPSRTNTVIYGEYQCSGRGADRSRRVPWSRSLSREDASPYMSRTFINGELWLRL